MRVAIDASALGSGRGGDETYLRGLLAGLAVGTDADDRFPLYMRSGTEVPPSVKGHVAFPLRFLAPRPELLRYSVSLPLALLRSKERVDLIHSLVYAPLWSPAPRAVLVPDLSFLHHPEFYPRKIRLRLNLLVPMHVRHARVIITLSEFCKRDLVNAYGLRPERVFVTYPAIEPTTADDWSAAGEPWMRNLGIRKPFIIYLGNLHPRKNIGRLIRAFIGAREIDDLAAHQLVIAGQNWWGHGAEEEREARRAPPGSVLFLGRVSDEQRNWLLRAAQLLAYPSFFEGFGLPPLEAMAVGTPVLASKASAIPETLGDAAHYVDPLSVDSIAAAIVRLVQSQQLRAELRERGFRQVRRYTAAAMGQQARAAFHWALGAGATHAPADRVAR